MAVSKLPLLLRTPKFLRKILHGCCQRSNPAAVSFARREIQAVDLLARHASRYITYGVLEGHERMYSLLTEIVPAVQDAVTKKKRAESDDGT